MKIKDLMTKEVATVGPDAPLKEVAAVLASRHISGVPVVSADGVVLGVVSEADILVKQRGELPDRGLVYAALHPSEMLELEIKLDARTAEEAMTTPVITIGPDEPIARAAALMIDSGVKRLPVTDDGRLVGILTRSDVVRAFVRSDVEIEHEIRNDVIKRALWITPSSIAVTVEDGIVTLEGRVETRTDAELIPEFVRRVPGVVDVRSRLTFVEAGKLAAAGL